MPDEKGKESGCEVCAGCVVILILSVAMGLAPSAIFTTWFYLDGRLRTLEQKAGVETPEKPWWLPPPPTNPKEN